MLFPEIAFGPIHSRRLGSSLGINLLPSETKICTFNCLYCECGFNKNEPKHTQLPTVKQISDALEKKLQDIVKKQIHVDVFTFAGNGEPTMHPNFGEIIDLTVSLRDKYLPESKISVLSNSTFINKAHVFRALQKVDNNILKLDSAIESTVRIINQPNQPDFSIERTIELLKEFNGKVIIQTLFFKGVFNGHKFDNTQQTEVAAWLDAIKKIKPSEVMLYSLDRKTPAEHLEHVDSATMQRIASEVENLGIKTLVTE